MKVYVSKLLKLNLYFILDSMTHSRFFFFWKRALLTSSSRLLECLGRLHFTVFSKTSPEPGVLFHQAVQKLYAISPDTIQAPRSEAEIRKAATIVIKHLVRHSHNCFRISAIPGSVEALTALLAAREEEVLEVLNRLVVDYRTCVRIGHTSGLISILVEFIQDEETSKEVFRQSLQLLKTLANVRGDSGRSLRKKIVSVVPAVRSLQRICNLEDLELAVDVIKLLAAEDELRDCIGATGGVIQSLMAIFARETAPNSDQLTIAMRAGEAIIVLVLQCPNNCSRLLMHKSYRQGGVSKTLKNLINMLTKPVGVHAATILRSLCAAAALELKAWEWKAAARRPDCLKVEKVEKREQSRKKELEWLPRPQSERWQTVCCSSNPCLVFKEFWAFEEAALAWVQLSLVTVGPAKAGLEKSQLQTRGMAIF
ncbi:hypothetical protein SELMODRAFT_413235 [Selaginella moellendorffii]|uniref:Uncharacterized protein n=1 Tax=Selaginella moellendorffii TaxID=88036 RepID=D8RNT0_SELML|nr:hypothetical protein SELMODRAFT_413235 [Selaginella moellendorffii]